MKQTLVTIRVEAQSRHAMAGMSTASLPVAEDDALAAARHLVEVLKHEPEMLELLDLIAGETTVQQAQADLDHWADSPALDELYIRELALMAAKLRDALLGRQS